MTGSPIRGPTTCLALLVACLAFVPAPSPASTTPRACNFLRAVTLPAADGDAPHTLWMSVAGRRCEDAVLTMEVTDTDGRVLFSQFTHAGFAFRARDGEAIRTIARTTVGDLSAFRIQTYASPVSDFVVVEPKGSPEQRRRILDFNGWAFSFEWTESSMVYAYDPARGTYVPYEFRTL